MNEADLHRLISLVLALSFGIAVAFGAIAQRVRFCTMGAVTDLAITGDWTRMRLWAVAAGTAVIGFNTMVWLGWVQAADSIYAGSRVQWLSALTGGALFGAGMVLASGCTSKNLLRAGSGNLKAVVVLLMVAFAGFATLKGISAVVRASTVDSVYFTLASGQDLPTLLSGVTGALTARSALLAGCVLGALLLALGLWSRESRTAELLLGGVCLGSLVVAAWWVSGVLAHVKEHPLTLEEAFLATNSRHMEGLSFVSAVSYSADYLLFFSDASKALTIGIVSAFGLICGSALHAVLTRSFRWEGFGNVKDLRNHLAGGVLMGVGGVTALGCTIGQGLSGVSTLSLASFLAVSAMILAAFATTRWQLARA